jgi:predicted HD superfamily hydrolase involved in NAD metabolism
MVNEGQMKTGELKQIRKTLEKELEPKRYEHTLGVAYTAATMAMVHDQDSDKALLAGMLHDCAKCLSFHRQLALCEEKGILLSEAEKEKDSPLLHAKAGMVLARQKYGIEDQDILNAICYHTTGRPGMSPLEKIIYIADYIEPGRKHAQNLPLVRKMAYQDLDDTMRQILSDSLSYLDEKGGTIDTMTEQTYRYYSDNSSNNN